MAGTHPFVSASTNHDYFNSFAGLTKLEKELIITEQKKSLVPFKPTGGTHGGTINPYPTYEPPKGEPKPPPPRGQNYIFRPSGVTGSYPIRSIIDCNVEIAPSKWMQNAITDSLKE